MWNYVPAGNKECGLNIKTKGKFNKGHLKCTEAASSHDMELSHGNLYHKMLYIIIVSMTLEMTGQFSGKKMQLYSQ